MRIPQGCSQAKGSARILRQRDFCGIQIHGLCFLLRAVWEMGNIGDKSQISRAEEHPDTFWGYLLPGSVPEQRRSRNTAEKKCEKEQFPNLNTALSYELLINAKYDLLQACNKACNTTLATLGADSCHTRRKIQEKI